MKNYILGSICYLGILYLAIDEAIPYQGVILAYLIIMWFWGTRHKYNYFCIDKTKKVIYSFFLIMIMVGVICVEAYVEVELGYWLPFPASVWVDTTTFTSGWLLLQMWIDVEKLNKKESN